MGFNSYEAVSWKQKPHNAEYPSEDCLRGLCVVPDRGSSSSGKRKTDALASYPQVVGGYHG